MTEKEILQFLGKVQSGSKDECWEWMGCRFTHGYGCATAEGKNRGAHRVAWEIANGEIPEGRWVLHKCDNPPCCNPAHLYLGTPRDNVRDMLERKRNRPPSGDEHFWRRHPERIIRGEQHGNAKITDDQVLEIRKRYAAGGITQANLAREYGLTHGTLSVIISGRGWSHLPVLGAPEKEYCWRGHEFTAETTRVRDRGKACKICAAEYQRKRRRRQREARGKDG